MVVSKRQRLAEDEETKQAGRGRQRRQWQKLEDARTTRGGGDSTPSPDEHSRCVFSASVGNAREEATDQKIGHSPGDR